MESMLGFNEHLQDDVVEDKSHSFKLVPWISWDEWKFVRESLFSSSPNSVASALQRISTWRSRGCIPVAIDVTASIVEIQQKDPYFRNDLNDSSSQSEEMLAMLYCMGIMRLVNCVIEKNRKKNEISIGEAADAIGIPRMLIDIRHEGSHRDLPSLQLVRLASKKERNQAQITEVALCLKAKQMAKSSSSHVKGKRVKQTAEHLYGRSKFLFLVAGKPSHSNSTVVYILLEYLLNALDSSNSEHLEDTEIVRTTENKQTAFDDWKSVVLKLSRKEPEFLMTLTEAVLEKMETNKGMDSEIALTLSDSSSDDNQSPENSTKSRRIELLSRLLPWLVGNLKTLNPVSKKESAENNKNSNTAKHPPEGTVMGLLRRCLLVSSRGNNQLMGSALTLAQLTGNTSLLHKLKKLALLQQPSNSETNSCNETLLSGQEYSIRQAEEKFELIKRRTQSNREKSNNFDVGSKSRWVVTKSWSSCPIGMLPSKIGFSGRLPVLDCVDECREIVPLSDNKEVCKPRLGKREAEIGVEKMDNTRLKKLETEKDCVMQDEADVGEEGVKGHMMIDGVWRKVGEEELFAIASAVKLLV
ncbi:hypothetical protein DH2020_005892 [Rehmannia glutinosa]|uniref:Las1-like protein n=1 Tax=Rehmannia glutinosa TaxID=99300 RepID=A0ABR0XHW5_REHGL